MVITPFPTSIQFHYVKNRILTTKKPDVFSLIMIFSKKLSKIVQPLGYNYLCRYYDNFAKTQQKNQ